MYGAYSTWLWALCWKMKNKDGYFITCYTSVREAACQRSWQSSQSINRAEENWLFSVLIPDCHLLQFKGLPLCQNKSMLLLNEIQNPFLLLHHTYNGISKVCTSSYLVSPSKKKKCRLRFWCLIACRMWGSCSSLCRIQVVGDLALDVWCSRIGKRVVVWVSVKTSLDWPLDQGNVMREKISDASIKIFNQEFTLKTCHTSRNTGKHKAAKIHLFYGKIIHS